MTYIPYDIIIILNVCDKYGHIMFLNKKKLHNGTHTHYKKEKIKYKLYCIYVKYNFSYQAYSGGSMSGSLFLFCSSLSFFV